MVVTGAPPGLVSIGGYRFAVSELQEFVGRPENGGGTLAILPDGLTGHRLAATAADRDAACAALAEAGANPLITGAFHERPRRSSYR
jgi:hypothetical protein